MPLKLFIISKCTVTKLENNICKHNLLEKRLEELKAKITTNNEKADQAHELSYLKTTSK